MKNMSHIEPTWLISGKTVLMIDSIIDYTSSALMLYSALVLDFYVFIFEYGFFLRTKMYIQLK